MRNRLASVAFVTFSTLALTTAAHAEPSNKQAFQKACPALKVAKDFHVIGMNASELEYLARTYKLNVSALQGGKLYIYSVNAEGQNLSQFVASKPSGCEVINSPFKLKLG